MMLAAALMEEQLEDRGSGGHRLSEVRGGSLKFLGSMLSPPASEGQSRWRLIFMPQKTLQRE